MFPPARPTDAPRFPCEQVSTVELFGAPVDAPPTGSVFLPFLTNATPFRAATFRERHRAPLAFLNGR